MFIVRSKPFNVVETPGYSKAILSISYRSESLSILISDIGGEGGSLSTFFQYSEIFLKG